MAETLQNFTWTARKATAALRVAEDELVDEAIAVEAKVTRQTLATWKQRPAFKARVREHVAELEASVKRFAIAKKRNRVRRQNADWERLQQIREERAVSPDMQDVPGGTTGLVVKQYKMVGSGLAATLVAEYVLDTGLVKSASDLEKQAAGEVGDDPAQKVRLGGDPDGAPIRTENAVHVFIPSNGREEPDDHDADPGSEPPAAD